MTAQLPLSLRWPRRQRFEYFHTGANAAAVTAVRTLVADHVAPWLFLSGPAGSGKTHLLLAACQAASAEARAAQYLPLAKLPDPAAAIRGVAGTSLIALDNLDAIADDADAQHALFDLYNRAKAEAASLIFAAEVTPILLKLTLPDLRSRLGACTQFVIKPLDDLERREVLKKQAAQRGIELDDAVLDWLFARHARDLGALLDLLDRLDQASLAAQRRITIPFLREVLRDPKD